MIEVRIRHESDGEAVHLCTWPTTDLDNLIPMIRRWSVAGYDERDLFGQFVVDETAAYFEVVIADGDDE